MFRVCLEDRLAPEKRTSHQFFPPVRLDEEVPGEEDKPEGPIGRERWETSLQSGAGKRFPRPGLVPGVGDQGPDEVRAQASTHRHSGELGAVSAGTAVTSSKTDTLSTRARPPGASTREPAGLHSNQSRAHRRRASTSHPTNSQTFESEMMPSHGELGKRVPPPGSGEDPTGLVALTQLMARQAGVEAGPASPAPVGHGALPGWAEWCTPQALQQ